jgi:hypothetical protein
MPVIQVQDEFQSGDNVTASSLNDLVNDASFTSGAVDNSTMQVASAGHLKVKDNGILSNHLKSDATNDSVRAVTTNHIRNDAVTNAKIADLAVDTDQIAADAVTYAKIQNVSETNRVLGRDSSGAGNVEEISPSALRTMINVEDGATADQTAQEIKTAYESNTNTNAFTDAEQTKLTGIEANATADQSALEIKTAYESNTNTNAFTDAEQTKLSGIEAGAEVNPSNATTSTSGLMSDTDKTKLDGIAAGAEVNVQSDWNASSGDALILNKPTIAYTSPISNATTSASGLMSAEDKTKLDGPADIADDGVTSTKISSTDTTFNINDTNNNIGTGALAAASYQLTVDSGTGKDTIYAKGNQAAAYVDLDLENENTLGLGGRMRIIQGLNEAVFQYQENGERATLNVHDGSLGANAGITIACSSVSQASVQPTGSMYSNPNSNIDLGSSLSTWDNGYINGGAWTGSDRNLKQDIEDLSEAELRVATALKGLMKKFRLKDAVVKKGADARIHVGVIAQDVKAAFEAEGLNAYRYAIIGEDTWWSKQDQDGDWSFKNEETVGYSKHTKMSVRYEQLLAFIISAM